MAKMSMIVLFVVLSMNIYQAQSRYMMDSDQDSPCEPCAVPMSYIPVCGTNGHTYSNKEAMECDNKCKLMDVRVAHQGICS